MSEEIDAPKRIGKLWSKIDELTVVLGRSPTIPIQHARPLMAETDEITKALRRRELRARR